MVDKADKRQFLLREADHFGSHGSNNPLWYKIAEGIMDEFYLTNDAMKYIPSYIPKHTQEKLDAHKAAYILKHSQK